MVQASTISAAVSGNPEWSQAVSQADGWIHELLGKWAESKTWEWDVRPGPDGHPLYDFRMKYEEASAADRFDRFEIANKRLLSDRVSAVWKQVLDSALAHQWKLVIRLVSELEREPALAN